MSAPESRENESRYLAPFRFGIAVGVVTSVFYSACLLTMFTSSTETAASFFDGLIYGIQVKAIITPDPSLLKAILGVISSFILAWLAGAMMALIYNHILKKSEPS